MFTQVCMMNDPSIFQQMGTKKCINKFGQDAVTILFKEFSEIVDYKVFECVDPHSLAKEQKRKAPIAISFIKLKMSLTLIKQSGRIWPAAERQVRQITTLFVYMSSRLTDDETTN